MKATISIANSLSMKKGPNFFLQSTWNFFFQNILEIYVLNHSLINQVCNSEVIQQSLFCARLKTLPQ